jgi:transglutaminase-like putative cysteine protease
VTWRLRVVHRSTYHYAGPVRASFNEARVTPVTTPIQLVLESNFSVRPGTRPQRYWDYWGTVVHAFDLHEPHNQLDVVATSLVETAQPGQGAGSLPWEEVDSPRTREDFAELLAATARVPFSEEVQQAGLELRREPTPKAAALAAMAWVRRRMRYVPGRTEVRTSALEALDGGVGVCQDFAHVSLALLRSAGIPGRYCSGYLHPVADAAIGVTVSGQSHAWFEYWDGDWRGLDPTIGAPVGEQHVLVARGRDYTDVCPLKGIYHGGPAEDLKVSVEITRLA